VDEPRQDGRIEDEESLIPPASGPALLTQETERHLLCKIVVLRPECFERRCSGTQINFNVAEVAAGTSRSLLRERDGERERAVAACSDHVHVSFTQATAERCVS
jgi:hypothetical protein